MADIRWKVYVERTIAILVLLLCACFAAGVSVYAQGTTEESVNQPVAAPVAVLDLRLGDVVDILAEYEVRHHDVPATGTGFYGLTDNSQSEIHIFEADLVSRRRAVIHELLHVVANRRGYGSSEEWILQVTPYIYAELFPPPVANPK